MKKLIFLLCSWHFSLVRKKHRTTSRNERTIILAHRGLTSRHLENTREAIIAAFHEGADGVEFDVQLTKDLVPVVTHDENLKRLCGIDKNISDLLWSDVQQLRQKSPRYETSYGIATLQEILSTIPDDKFTNIELKETVLYKWQAGIDAVLDVIGPYKPKLKIVISSFLPDILYKVSSRDSDVQLGYLLDESHAWLSYLRGIKILSRMTFLNPHLNLLGEKTFRMIKNLGVDLVIWGHHQRGQELRVFQELPCVLITDVAEEMAD